MTFMGWIVLALCGLATLYFTYRLISDVMLNRRLKIYQKQVGEVVFRPKVMFWVKRSYGALISSMFVLATIFSQAFVIPPMLGDRVLVNAKALTGEAQLRSLMSGSYGGIWRDVINTDAAFENMVPGQPEGAAGDIAERDFIGTNNQVEGVEEADLIKTDGNMIYYASRYQNQVRIFTIGQHGVATLDHTLDLGDVYTDSIFLTDDYLIVIGYNYTYMPFVYDMAVDVVGWRYVSYTGSVVVYDRETLEVSYKLETDANFYQYRLIDQSLYLISNAYLQDDDPRPSFAETNASGQTKTSYLEYSSIYYFDNVPAYGMTVFTGISLDDFSVNSQAFLGYVNLIYADEDNLYTTFNYYDSSNFIDSIVGYTTKTQILKFKMHTDEATLEYIGHGIVYGHISDQYWMDEYNGYLRVVTTDWNPIKNRLYVLKESDTTDELQVVGSIIEGLGKPNERVFSVDFQGTTGYVVTFEQIDPRYMIDLSNPAKPTIVKAMERPGFSTYLHIWNESGTQVVGFGFTADSNGRVTGMEIVAADDTLGIEDSYQLLNQNQEGTWSYSYSEASYNPKALMISPKHGIIAFPVMSWSYTYLGNYNYQYTYKSQYLVFYIDFTKENPEDIISEPIVIDHPSSTYYFGIDRGIYISETGDQGFEMIYTFSNLSMISYNLRTKEIMQTITFELPEWMK